MFMIKEKEYERKVDILYSKQKEFKCGKNIFKTEVIKGYETNMVNQIKYKFFEIKDVILIYNKIDVVSYNRRKLN